MTGIFPFMLTVYVVVKKKLDHLVLRHIIFIKISRKTCKNLHMLSGLGDVRA